MGGASVRRAMAGGVMMLALAGPAMAAHVSGGFAARANATVTIDGVSAAGTVTNGVASGVGTAGGGIFTGGPLTPGGTGARVEALASFNGDSVAARATASLERGLVTAQSVVVDGGFGNVVSGASGELIETIWFTNTSGQWQPLTYWIEVDGAFLGNLGRQEFYARANLSNISASGCNQLGECVSLGNGMQALQAGAATAYTVGFIPGQGGFFTQDTLGAVGSWTLTGLAGNAFDGGPWNFRLSTTLWVPTGETSLLLNPQLVIPFCGTGGSGACDFGNTGKTGFGALPNGLTWASESGLFLTGLDAGPAVPEPASWAMLIVGFGLTGSVARRRVRALAV